MIGTPTDLLQSTNPCGQVTVTQSPRSPGFTLGAVYSAGLHGYAAGPVHQHTATHRGFALLQVLCAPLVLPLTSPWQPLISVLSPWFGLLQKVLDWNLTDFFHLVICVEVSLGDL